MKLTRQEILKLAVSTMYIGLLIDLIGPGVFYVAGQLIRGSNIVSAVEPEPLQMLGYMLLFVSAAEIALVVVLRRRWINAKSSQLRLARQRPVFYRQLKIMFIILYLIALTPSVYGFLYFILGGKESFFVLMLVISLIGYMLIKMKPDAMEETLRDIELEDVD